MNFPPPPVVADGDFDHPSTRWETGGLDLSAYLERIGYAGPLEPDLDTLRALQAAHLDAVPFEAVDPYLGRPVPLDIGALQDKLVHRRRGGYCHEHNILFATVLDRLGFRVTGRSARMLMGSDERQISEIGHTILSVVIDDVDWHVDVGIGSAGPRGPIALAEGEVSATGRWRYRMDRSRLGHWLLRLWRPEGWFNLIQFTTERYWRADYDDQNYVVATRPTSPFVQRLVVQRNGAEIRHSLTDLTLTSHLPDGRRHRRDIVPAEIPDALRVLFRIRLPPELECALVERTGEPRDPHPADVSFGA